jgi:hypothetical protein
VDGVHGGILLGIVVNFIQMQTGVAWSFNLIHNTFSLMEIEDVAEIHKVDKGKIARLSLAIHAKN